VTYICVDFAIVHNLCSLNDGYLITTLTVYVIDCKNASLLGDLSGNCVNFCVKNLILVCNFRRN